MQRFSGSGDTRNDPFSRRRSRAGGLVVGALTLARKQPKGDAAIGKPSS
jgi:hypothetical protein